MRGEVPEGWEAARLGDLAKFYKGKGLPKAEITPDGDVPCIHYGELFTKYGEEITTVLSRTLASKTAFLSRRNDVLMPTSDVTPSGLATASVINDEGVVLGGDILVIRCPEGVLLGRHLSAWIRLSKRTILGLASGTTVYHIYSRDMALLPILLPPLPEQRKIAAILSSVDEAIAATEVVIAQTRRVKEGLLQDLLTRGIGRGGRPHTRSKKTEIGEVPESWEVQELGSFARVKGGKRLPKGSRYSDTPTPYRYIRVSDFAEGSVALESVKCVDKSIRDAIARYTITSRDLYISIAGTLGVVGTVPEELDGSLLTENAAKIVFGDERATDLGFMKAVMQSEIAQSQILTKKGVGGGVPKLALFRIASIKVPLPPIHEQREIGTRLAEVDGLHRHEEQMATQLRQTKAGLLQDLLTGKVRVSV